MARNWLFLLVAAVVFPAIAFLVASQQLRLGKSAVHTYSYETTISWKDHGNVELNVESLRRLNSEVADRMFVAGLRDQQYRVVSLGKGSVEAMYLDDKVDLAPTLRAQLEAYIRQRAPELAALQH